MNEINVKYFTPEEANRALPFIKQIVRDILNTSFEIQLIIDSLGEEVLVSPVLQNLIHKMESFTAELMEIGCHYQNLNFNIGLVNIPSIIDDEEVYLCWKSDEEKISYYYGINEEFDAHKKLPEEYFVKETNMS